MSVTDSAKRLACVRKRACLNFRRKPTVRHAGRSLRDYFFEVCVSVPGLETGTHAGEVNAAAVGGYLAPVICCAPQCP